MATRGRQSTVAPTQSRSAGVGSLPPYEAPTFSLSPAAQRALADLTTRHKLRSLEECIADAKVGIAHAAADINERLTIKENATKKRRLNQPPNSQKGEHTQINDVDSSLQELRDKVERMTQRMDEGMRKTIDGQYSTQFIKDAIAATAENARANASTQASTLNARSQRQRRLADDAEEDYQDFEPTDPTNATQYQPSAIEKFRKTMDDAKTRYQSHSLASRYAENNDYRDFRRVVHDARHPEDDVPLPHHSEWFPEAVVPGPGLTTRARADGDDEEDDDIAVSRATISTKCPLTLQEFKKPLTSKKCPHSFESEPILNMIAQSQHRLGAQPGARGNLVGGERAVQCPVPGCGEMLTKDDLHTDTVIMHKIKRIQRAKELEEEEADDEDERRYGSTQRNATLIDDNGEDDDEDVDKVLARQTQQVKREQLRGTKAPPPSTPPVGMADDSDEETEDEDTIEE